MIIFFGSGSGNFLAGAKAFVISFTREIFLPENNLSFKHK